MGKLRVVDNGVEVTLDVFEVMKNPVKVIQPGSYLISDLIGQLAWWLARKKMPKIMTGDFKWKYTTWDDEDKLFRVTFSREEPGDQVV